MISFGIYHDRDLRVDNFFWERFDDCFGNAPGQTGQCAKQWRRRKRNFSLRRKRFKPATENLRHARQK